MSKRQKIECAVCVEDTAPSKVVKCPFCDFSCCKSCFTRVLFDGSNDANCMNCHRRFDREILMNAMSNHFVNTQYKTFRERVLFEREQAMIPATMPYVELERDASAARARMNELVVERDRLRRLLRQVQSEYDMQQRITWRTEPNVEVIDTERRSFTQRCTREGCLGWLNSAYRCGVCTHFSCPKCLVPCGTTRASLDEHVCDPEEAATVAAIRNDSTPCPACGIRVSRVSGCSQMWCVQCHCAFDYRTGAKINGMIHNPHWILYQQQNATTTTRNPADIPCGAMPTVGELRVVHGATTTLVQTMRIVTHIEQVEIPRLNPRADLANRHWRVRYILGNISEVEFKSRVQRQDKIDSKNHEVSQVLEMLCHTLTDELRQVAVRIKAVGTAETAALSLIEYGNRVLNCIALRYSQVTPRIMTELGVWRVLTRYGTTREPQEATDLFSD